MDRLKILIIILCITGCAVSPLGRKQLNLFPEAEMERMGLAAFNEMKKNTPQSDDPNVDRYVNCVARSVTSTLEGEWAGKTWEVTVFKDDSANAFALPGGKIGVHTGLLNVAKNQHQLAAVLGHEVAHVLAHHGNERASQQFAANTGLEVLGALGGANSSKKATVMAVLGLGAQFGVLMPFSRLQESESDLLGLDLIANAGFDPRESTVLWENMSAGGTQKIPEFMSTHPSHETRIQDLQQRIPAALEIRHRAQSAGRSPLCSR